MACGDCAQNQHRSGRFEEGEAHLRESGVVLRTFHLVWPLEGEERADRRLAALDDVGDGRAVALLSIQVNLELQSQSR